MHVLLGDVLAGNPDGSICENGEVSGALRHHVYIWLFAPPLDSNTFTYYNTYHTIPVTYLTESQQSLIPTQSNLPSLYVVVIVPVTKIILPRTDPKIPKAALNLLVVAVGYQLDLSIKSTNMGDPTKTRQDSASIYSTATLVEEDNQWCGHPPCVSFSSELGCRQHNSAQSPMYRNTLLPPDGPPERPAEKQFSKPRIVRLCGAVWRSSQSKLISTGAPEAATIYSKPQSLFFSSLPFDPVSVNTIQPIHASMPHHLAFYHLHCIRRQLSPKISIAFIPELSCNGTAHFYERGPEFAWSSEVYLDSGTFLQKQEISCVLEPGPDVEDINFSECPHRFFKLGKLSSIEKNGWMEAKCELRFYPFYWLNEIRDRQWNSKDGRFTSMGMCLLCHSDHEKVMEVVGRQLHIRLTCYRDLGSGTDRNQDEWTAVSTGQVKTPWRRTLDYKEVYGRVWRTAKRLGRPNLHVTIYKREGEKDFDVSKLEGKFK